MKIIRRAALPAALVLLAGIAACSNDKADPKQSNTQPAPAQTTANAAKPAATGGHDDHAGPHNLHWVKGGPGNGTGASAGLLSGGVPEGEEDFAHLRDLGIKTVISVDGASPDVETARKYGLTYIHIPTTYARVTTQEQTEVARAVSSSLDKGNVFIHCHHGKHRSPAQAAGAAVAMGWMTPEQAVAFMKNAGTAPTYEGLYACISEAKPLDAAVLNAPVREGEFAPIRKPSGIVDAMVEVDLAFDHLSQIKAAGWKVPADSPDLVPASEAGRLADHLRHSAEDTRSKARGDAFLKSLADSATKASALEEGFVRKADSKTLDTLWAPVAASCKDCHKQFK